MRYSKSYPMLRSEYDIAASVEQYLTSGYPKAKADLYSDFGLRGPHGSRSDYCQTYNTSRYKRPAGTNGNYVERCQSLLRMYINRIRDSRRDRRVTPTPSLVEKYKSGSSVRINDRLFDPGYVHWLHKRICEWRPGNLSYGPKSICAHSSKHNFDSQTQRLTYTASMAKMRYESFILDGDAHVPIIVSDKFILDYMLEGKPYVPSIFADGDVIPVRYIEGDRPHAVKDGFVAKVGDSYGCGNTARDAVKGAKMRAVRKAKKTLGIL